MASTLLCFECGDVATEMHHVVPQSLGGTKKVPLCPTCHGKVHGMRRTDIRRLTAQGLERARARGVRLGGPVTIGNDVAARIVALKSEGKGLRAIAEALNQEGIKPARGGSQWYASTVRVVLQRESK